MSSMPEQKVKTHLIAGFLGTGKTTALRYLLAQKPTDEKWIIIVNEFGEIGIDGAALSNNEVPVAEISGGCLCCVAGPQLTSTVAKMIRQYRPNRLLIEASGLAHAASVLDELKQAPLGNALHIAANLTIVDPRQFIDPNYNRQSLYQDQISIADILVGNKVDLCDAQTLDSFDLASSKLFPTKTLVVKTSNGEIKREWLDLESRPQSRYRIKNLEKNELHFQSEGFTFSADLDFDGEKLSCFFDQLPSMCEGLVRAKGIFKVLGTWVWLNWVDNQWGAAQVSWRKDNRFEVIANNFDANLIENNLKDCIEQ